MRLNYEQINHDYHSWLIRQVSPPGGPIRGFDLLLDFLDTTEFYAVIQNDENRIYDGLELRLDYADECDLDYDILDEIRGNCTVLEMMVALAKRMEDDILGDPDLENRTYIWFQYMIDGLELPKMDDAHFDLSYCEDILWHFLNRKKRFGKNILLFKYHSTENLKNGKSNSVEIWYQMHAFIRENCLI